MHRKDAGFTLTEAMIVVAVAAVGIGMAVPAFSGTMQRVRVVNTLNMLSTDMAMARGAAITSRTIVSVCPRDESNRCKDDAEWSRGWIVFRDQDGNQQPDAAADALRVADAPGNSALSMPGSRSLVSFRPNGRASGTNLTVNVCQEGRVSAKVVVNNLGRVRSEKPSDQAPCPSA